MYKLRNQLSGQSRSVLKFKKTDGNDATES